MTYIIIIFTALISISAFNKPELLFNLQFNPYKVIHSKEYYRIFSHALIHADWNHLIFNMLTLYFFGDAVESTFKYYFGAIGLFYFIFMYVAAMFISSIYTLVKHKDDYSYNAVGASGAVSAVLFAFILLNPLEPIYFIFIPIGIPAIVFGVAYLLYSAYMSKQNMDNIGHDAHFYGAVFGFLFPLLLDYNLIYNFIGKLFNF